MSLEELEEQSAEEKRWEVIDGEDNVVKKGFESEEAAEIWTTTAEGKQAAEKSGGLLTVQESSADGDGNEEEE
ncbi:MAG TPA: hypothetical protein VNG29_03650 [Candidatus Paceibacterota bacterium]|nr:hypothetical protein [Candidatus Paceibacterota bacterium]